MKKAKLTCLCLLMLLVVLCLTSCGDTAEENADFAYMLNSTSEFARILRYKAEGAEVVIPDTLGGKPVQEIAQSAFDGATHVTSIQIPANVKKIEDPSFSALPNLKTITVSDENVGFAVVDGVLFHKKLKTVYCYPQGKEGNSYTLPDSVTTIGASAFYNTQLKQLSMSDAVTKIYESAFAGSKKLETVKLSGKLSQLYENAFADCESLKDVALPQSLTSIGTNCFKNCKRIETIQTPAAMAALGSGAFEGCQSLKTVTVLSAGVQRIAENTFKDCQSLKSVSFAAELLGVANDAFRGCENLAAFTLTDKLQVLGESAFMDCPALINITIPNTLTQIGGRAFENTAFLNSNTDEFVIVGGGALIAYRGKAADVVIPQGVTAISYLNEAIESIVIPEGVVLINDGAFSGCSLLKGITLPKSLTTIGNRAFDGCESLAGFSVSQNVASIGEKAFTGCTGIEAFSVESGNKSFMVDKGVLYNSVNKFLIAYPAASTMTSYAVPYGVKRVAPYAVQGAKNLEAFDGTTSEELLDIDAYAFADCGKLQKLTLHENFRNIGSNAFMNCVSLSDYTPNYMMTNIGANAFENCTALKQFTINQPVAKIGKDAFKGNTECEFSVYKGTVGEEYAKTNNLKYVIKK